jgi:hypothetical protein
MHWPDIMRRVSIHPLVLLHTSRRCAFEREAARVRVADSGFNVTECKPIRVHTARTRFTLLASAKVQTESVVRDRKGEVAKRRVICGSTGVDPDTVFAGGETVAVYACGLDEDL